MTLQDHIKRFATIFQAMRSATGDPAAFLAATESLLDEVEAARRTAEQLQRRAIVVATVPAAVLAVAYDDGEDAPF